VPVPIVGIGGRWLTPMIGNFLPCLGALGSGLNMCVHERGRQSRTDKDSSGRMNTPLYRKNHRLAGRAAAGGFGVIVLFQVALALGAPLVRAVWGGSDEMLSAQWASGSRAG
jgi:hypothetical protein